MKQPEGMASAIAMKHNDSAVTCLLSGKETMWKMASTQTRSDLVEMEAETVSVLGVGVTVDVTALPGTLIPSLLSRNHVLLCCDG